nr:hypothetical protein CFP56_55231 [Quercus suber]
MSLFGKVEAEVSLGYSLAINLVKPIQQIETTITSASLVVLRPCAPISAPKNSLVKRKWIVVWILARSHAPKVNHRIKKGSNNFRG